MAAKILLKCALRLFLLTMIDRDNINIKGNIAPFFDSGMKIRLEGSRYTI